MSYNLKINAADGVVTVQDNPGNVYVPDGSFIVNGHEGAGGLSLTVTRYDTDGNVVLQAQAMRAGQPAMSAAPEPAPVNLEAPAPAQAPQAPAPDGGAGE